MRNREVSICVVIPFFGSWPSWFPYYLLTCSNNPTIDWLFFCDHDPPEYAPSNVRFVHMTLEQVRQLAESQIGATVNLDYPTRICNLKPMYGVIFSDWLRKYTWWAWGDVDVLYGNIRRFLPHRYWVTYDIISCRPWYTTGELTFLRNTNSICNLFRSSTDWRMVLSSHRCWAFDEYGFFKDRSVDSFTHVIWREAAIGSVKPYFGDFVRTEASHRDRNMHCLYTNQALYDLRTGEEIMLVHFLKSKALPEFVVEPVQALPAKPFILSASGIRLVEYGGKPPINVSTFIKSKIWRTLRRIKYRFFWRPAK